MLYKFINFVKNRQKEIILIIGVVLISFLSFAAGYIVSEQQNKAPIRFEKL